MCKRGKGEKANVKGKSQFFTNEEILKFVHISYGYSPKIYILILFFLLNAN